MVFAEENQGNIAQPYLKRIIPNKKDRSVSLFLHLSQMQSIGYADDKEILQ
jgi:hypothetical protein